MDIAPAMNQTRGSEIRRLLGWRTRLASVLLEAPARHFEWGVHDCCIGLAIPAVQAVIGLDLGSPYRGTYNTAAGALLVLKRQGFDSLVDIAAANFTRQHRATARGGDLAAIPAAATGWGLGVVIGSRIAVLALAGYATVDLSAADHIYRVGK
jgi:hypothetical protein